MTSKNLWEPSLNLMLMQLIFPSVLAFHSTPDSKQHKENLQHAGM